MRPQFERPVVCLISSGALTDENFAKNHPRVLRLFLRACQSGVSLIQLREKQLSAKNLVLLTQAAVARACGTNTKVLVNERFDIAVACGAGGVHLPSTAMSVSDVRQHVPEHFIIGASTHSEEELADAFNGGADFAVFGPIFETPGKPVPVGIDKLHEVCVKFFALPILALGGIAESNIDAVLSSDAAGFAAISYLNDTDGLTSIVKKINR